MVFVKAFLMVCVMAFVKLTKHGGLLLLLVLCINSTPAHAFEWADLWSSAEQRALKKLEQQQYDELIEQAPDANWRALGEYRKGEFAAAAKSFAEQRALAEESGSSDVINRASYNQANAHVRNAEYQQAIDLYEDVLGNNPQHENARHNREIAQQLLELQQEQQQEQQEQQQQQNSDDQDEQQDSSDSNDQQDQQDGEQQSGDEQSDEESQDRNNESQDSQSQSDEQADETQDAEEAAEAAAAMQAEQQRALDESDARQVEANADAQAEPLTEREQANEQWLRQIPDDPAGLLERKIQNRHLTDFPKVKDSDEPW